MGVVVSGFLLVVIAAIAKSIQDIISHKYGISVFSKYRDRKYLSEGFWNPYKSWKNKWDYTKGVAEERFFGSSTIFVFLTDAWHLFQSIHINGLFFSLFLLGLADISLVSKIGLFVVFHVCYTGVFTIFYKWVWIYNYKK